MGRDHQYDDDFADDDLFDANGILRDGRRLKVPIKFLDSTQRAIALSRPGFANDDSDDSDAQAEAKKAHREYCEFLRTAHQAPSPPPPVVGSALYLEQLRKNPLTRQPFDSQSPADAAAAYDEMCQWMRDAHKGGQP